MADDTTPVTLTRIEVDFNTLTSAPVDLVKIAAPGSWQEQRLPPLLRAGQRALLFDADGLEVEATILRDEQGWWLATPDGATWHNAQHDAQPATEDVSDDASDDASCGDLASQQR